MTKAPTLKHFLLRPSRSLFLSASLILGLGLAACTTLADTPPPAANPAPQPASQATPAAGGFDIDHPSLSLPPLPLEAMRDISAWQAQSEMGLGVNIGNTLENTTRWETGWGNPVITREFVQSLADMGYKNVRLPVAWDTWSRTGQVEADKFQRVAEVARWIIDAGMYCVINIHWDGGWIDSSWEQKFSDTLHTFSPEAQRKFKSYWWQIATYFQGMGEKLIFEALNEETNFENEGNKEDAYQTLTRVNQLFVDTVRATGGNNSRRILIVTGYSTDFTKTSDFLYQLPLDPVPGKLMISVHYYTPWNFCGMEKDESWGKVAQTWGDPVERSALDVLFKYMAGFSTDNDIPVYVGEYGVTSKRESSQRIKWMQAVIEACLKYRFIPVLWDTGTDVSRKPPYGPSTDLQTVLDHFRKGAK